MEINVSAKFSALKGFTTKENIEPKIRLTFTSKEEGTACLLRNFDSAAATSDGWNTITVPLDYTVELCFNSDVRMSGVLHAIGASRKKSELGATVTYNFQVDVPATSALIDKLVLPYFKAKDVQGGTETDAEYNLCMEV